MLYCKAGERRPRSPHNIVIDKDCATGLEKFAKCAQRVQGRLRVVGVPDDQLQSSLDLPLDVCHALFHVDVKSAHGAKSAGFARPPPAAQIVSSVSPGLKVYALFRDGWYYPGTVESAEKSGLEVLFDDGDRDYDIDMQSVFFFSDPDACLSADKSSTCFSHSLVDALSGCYPTPSMQLTGHKLEHGTEQNDHVMDGERGSSSDRELQVHNHCHYVCDPTAAADSSLAGSHKRKGKGGMRKQQSVVLLDVGSREVQYRFTSISETASKARRSKQYITRACLENRDKLNSMAGVIEFRGERFFCLYGDAAFLDADAPKGKRNKASSEGAQKEGCGAAKRDGDVGAASEPRLACVVRSTTESNRQFTAETNRQWAELHLNCILVRSHHNTNKCNYCGKVWTCSINKWRRHFSTAQQSHAKNKNKSQSTPLCPNLSAYRRAEAKRKSKLSSSTVMATKSSRQTHDEDAKERTAKCGNVLRHPDVRNHSIHLNVNDSSPELYADTSGPLAQVPPRATERSGSSLADSSSKRAPMLREEPVSKQVREFQWFGFNSWCREV